MQGDYRICETVLGYESDGTPDICGETIPLHAQMCKSCVTLGHRSTGLLS